MSKQAKSRPPAMNGMLSGVKVLDVTNVLAGPFTSYLLTLLGAHTIKVENPRGGDLARALGGSPELSSRGMGASFIAQNAGKQSLALDLKAAKGKEVFRKLAAGCDVLVENFRPGVMDRLGLGYEALRQVKPDLIYCAISGFGQDGPDAFNPAYDQIIQGKSGLMAVTGSDETGPLRCGIPIADTVGGLNAAFSIAAALYQREVTGQGRFLDISLLDSMLPMMGWVVSNLLLADMEPVRMGNENFTAAPSGSFETKDGQLNISANKDEQWRELCAILGLEDLPGDPRFEQRDERKKNRYELRPILNEKLKKKSAAQWEEILNKRGIPSGMVLSLKQALEQPQVRHRQILKKIADPELGELTVCGLPGQDQPAPSAPPRLGEHTREILLGLGYSEAELTEMAEENIIGLPG